jgi:hypothetical protein
MAKVLTSICFLTTGCNVVAQAPSAAPSAPTVLLADEQLTCNVYDLSPYPIEINPALGKPQDVAVDGAGDIFVVDQARAEVIQINGEDRTTSTVLMGPETLQVPVGITISPVNADLYVGDENTSTVWLLNCQGRNQNYCTQYYNTPLNISLPSNIHPLGLQTDAEEHLFIADNKGQRVWRRDSGTTDLITVMSQQIMEALGIQGTNAFSPQDIAIDPSTLALVVTDVANDDIWTLPCMTPSPTGLACDIYSGIPNKAELTGTDILEPSGIDVDYLGTKYVASNVNGIVAEVTNGNVSTDLLDGSIGAPQGVTIDKRATSKALYITDDYIPGGDDSSYYGLYALPCLELVCIPLDDRIVPNVKSGSCALTTPGSDCELVCKNGFVSSVTHIECTANGWTNVDVICAPPVSNEGNDVQPAASGSNVNSNGSVGTTAAPTGMSAGGAVGITIAVLVVVGAGVFLFIRYRQGKLVIKKAGDYTTTFGETDNNV